MGKVKALTTEPIRDFLQRMFKIEAQYRLKRMNIILKDRKLDNWKGEKFNIPKI